MKYPILWSAYLGLIGVSGSLIMETDIMAVNGASDTVYTILVLNTMFFGKALKLSIADMSGSEDIRAEHISEAAQYRFPDSYSSV